MSASGPPLCRICQKEHWMRDPHILPANAPAEKRSKREVIIATYTPPSPPPRTKADKVTPGKRKTAPKAKKRKGKKK